MRRFDAPRALSRLARAAVCVGAFLGPFAGAAWAAPNDDPTAASAIVMKNWAGTEFEVGPVTYTDWSSATDLNDQDPSCTGADYGHSLWWYVTVSEPSTLKVTVSSTNVASFAPVVTLYNAKGDEQACATTHDSLRVSPTPVSVNAYVFPNDDGTPQRYLIRVAQAFFQLANNRSGYDLLVTGKDLTPPHVVVSMPKEATRLKTTVTYDATATVDGESEVKTDSGIWTFNDGFVAVPQVMGMTATHTWKTPGLHKVTFSVADNANNQTTYTFFVFVHDWTPPKITNFGVKSVPYPGGRWMTIVVTHDEPVTLHLTITQGDRLLWRGNMRLLKKNNKATRKVHLRAKVWRAPWIDITGSAKDSADNTTVLPGCHLNAVSGKGRCFQP
jgi:hypothetical protein